MPKTPSMGTWRKCKTREDKTITVIVSTPTGLTSALLDSTGSSARFMYQILIQRFSSVKWVQSDCSRQNLQIDLHGTILWVLSNYTGAWCTVGCLFVCPFQFLEQTTGAFCKMSSKSNRCFFERLHMESELSSINSVIFSGHHYPIFCLVFSVLRVWCKPYGSCHICSSS